MHPWTHLRWAGYFLATKDIVAFVLSLGSFPACDRTGVSRGGEAGTLEKSRDGKRQSGGRCGERDRQARACKLSPHLTNRETGPGRGEMLRWRS